MSKFFGLVCVVMVFAMSIGFVEAGKKGCRKGKCSSQVCPCGVNCQCGDNCNCK